MASFAISQQPLPWPTASTTPPPPPPPHTGTAKRIRIKRETCFSLASCSGPMTSPLQPPAPKIPAAQHIFPSHRRPSILFEFHHFIPISRLLQKCLVYVHISTCCILLRCSNVQPGYRLNPFIKSIKHIKINISEKNKLRKQLVMTERFFDVISQCSPNCINALIQICG